MEVVTIVLVCLTASYVLSEALRSIKLPRVLGPVLVGFILGLPALEGVFLGAGSGREVLEAFSQLGLIFLMFYSGLNLNLGSLRDERKNALSIISLSFGLPFLIGFLVLWLVFGFPFLLSVLVGALLSISAEAVSVDVLRELDVLEGRIGQLVLAVGTMDDVVEVTVLSVVVALVAGAVESFTIAFLHLIILVGIVYVSRYLVVPLVLRLVGSRSRKSELLVASLIMVLFMSVAADVVFKNLAGGLRGVGMVVGALIAGVVVRYTLIEDEEEEEREEITDLIEVVTFGFFSPFFFIKVGMETDISLFFSSPGLGLALFFIVMLFQPFGAAVGNVLAGHGFWEGLSIGFGLSTKGGVELIAASLLLSAGVISEEFFTAIIMMAFFATLISPVLFKSLSARVIGGSVEGAPEE